MSILCTSLDQPVTEAATMLGAGLEMPVHLFHGDAPDCFIQETLDKAQALGAKLIVVQVSDNSSGSRLERLARASGLPVLALRKPQVFREWLEEHRTLTVLVADNFTGSSLAALHWAGALAQHERCEVVLTHLFWPLMEAEKRGLTSTASYVEADPGLTRILARELEVRLNGFAEHINFRMRIEPRDRKLGDRLAEIVREERADVVVLGVRAHESLSLHGSVARAIMLQTHASLVCIPERADPDSSKSPLV